MLLAGMNHMLVNIVNKIFYFMNTKLSLLVYKKTSQAYNSVRQELVDFLVKNQDRQSALLTYLANIALSDSFYTLHSCLTYTINLLRDAKKTEINERSVGYLFIFLYLNFKLESKSLWLYKLIKTTVKCRHCGKDTALIIHYKHNAVCQYCGN